MNQQKLNDLFEYRDGSLYWKIKPSRRVFIGDKVGSLDIYGYLRTKIEGKGYKIHRLIFLMHYGYLPKFIDHIDNNKANNRIENLREVTRSEDQHNRKLGKDNTSGHKNVAWHKNSQKWRVCIRVYPKTVHIGCFDDLELADLVAQEARHKYHKEFARHK